MVEILNGLAGGAFAKIVETRDDDQALAGLVQDKANVTEIGVGYMLQLGQRARGPDANHGPTGVELAIEGFDRFRGLLGRERHVNGGKNASRKRQQMRRENELRFGEAGVLENFGRVAVREKIVGFEIFVDFDELQIAPGIFACAAGTGFAIADDVLVWSDKTGFGERAQSEDDAGGVAAGIGDQAGFGDFFGIQFGKAVDSFAKVI